MTQLTSHVTAYRAGRITTAQLRHACPFAFPPPDATDVADLIRKTVADEGHVGRLPNSRPYVKTDETQDRILAFLATVPGATSPAIAQMLGMSRTVVVVAMEKLLTRGDVDREREASRNWVWRVADGR